MIQEANTNKKNDKATILSHQITLRSKVQIMDCQEHKMSLFNNKILSCQQIVVVQNCCELKNTDTHRHTKTPKLQVEFLNSTIIVNYIKTYLSVIDRIEYLDKNLFGKPFDIIL